MQGICRADTWLHAMSKSGGEDCAGHGTQALVTGWGRLWAKALPGDFVGSIAPKVGWTSQPLLACSGASPLRQSQASIHHSSPGGPMSLSLLLDLEGLYILYVKHYREDLSWHALLTRYPPGLHVGSGGCLT